MSTSPLFHPLRVQRIAPDTDEAMVIDFEVPEALQPVFAFTQGQYLTLRATIDGQDLRRSYSICAGVDDGQLRVGVRRVKGGVFSQWLHTRLHPGDTLQVMAPQGRFHVPLQPEARRHYLGIAGGSGITPILSIVKTVLSREPLSRFTLIYGNRTLASTMFKEALEDLKNRHMARLVLHHVFSDEPSERPLGQGVLDRTHLGRMLAQLVPVRDPGADAAVASGVAVDHAFICGPFQMNDEAEAALRAAGLAPERIHIERFGLAPGAAAAGQGAGVGTGAGTGEGTGEGAGAVLHQAAPGDAERARITVVRDGLTRHFDFQREQPSLLDAAVAAGLELPFSCTSGVCGTCRAKVQTGQVRMERNYALDAADIAAGFVLCCQAHPLTPQVTLDFDAR